MTRLQKVYETSTNPEFQEGALRLLAEFEDPALIQRSLDYAVSGKVRNQDAAIQLAIALQIDASRDQAWKFIEDNWDKVHALLTTEMGEVLVVQPAVSAPLKLATACRASSPRTRSLPTSR